MGRGMIARVLPALVWLLSCAPPPPPPASPPDPVPPPAPPPAPTTTFDPPVHDCGQDPAAESPIVVGKLGEGERIVRLINNSPGEIQARLLDETLEPAVAGTLHLRAGETAEFHVPEGIYMVRYRHGGTCEVRRGAKLVLTGPRAGVEISIRPRFERGTQSNMQKVSEPL